jgi:hypothetical protein
VISPRPEASIFNSLNIAPSENRLADNGIAITKRARIVACGWTERAGIVRELLYRGGWFARQLGSMMELQRHGSTERIFWITISPRSALYFPFRQSRRSSRRLVPRGIAFVTNNIANSTRASLCLPLSFSLSQKQYVIPAFELPCRAKNQVNNLLRLGLRYRQFLSVPCAAKC